MTNLLIVESPGKIQKLKAILGKGWQVIATYGHFKQLEDSGHNNLGFDLGNNRVECRFKASSTQARKTISYIKSAAQKADRIYIASDPDREGEVIAWHVLSILPSAAQKKTVRVSYSEITEEAVTQAIASPRQIDFDKVGAGLARNCLDKLVGYSGSPLVWNLGAKSIGRVQSAVLALVCDREKEIENFRAVDYFLLTAQYDLGFSSIYFELDKGINKANNRVYDRCIAQQILEVARNNPHRVASVEQKRVEKKPPKPFTTSTLQQVGSNKLGFSPKKVMKIAQTLYERGLITYMRTDSVELSTEFLTSARSWLQKNDPDNVSDTVYKGKNSKNAQEAHEAIRPTKLNVASEKLQQELSSEEFKLYLYIWKRAIASICPPALLDKTTIVSRSGDTTWQATGQTVAKKGYSKYWCDIEAESILPAVKEGNILSVKQIDGEKKRTSPPPRYTEAQLIALLEKLGIGRPSTYAPSVEVIKSRKYASLKKRRLVPTELGQRLNCFMQDNFTSLVNSSFTSQMESSLDKIATGEVEWQSFLCNWNESYFDPTLKKAQAIIDSASPSSSVQSKPKPRLTKFPCPVCNTPLELYVYNKGKTEKSLLRCSNSENRKKTNHESAVFFKTKKNQWWSKEYGILKP